MLAQWGRSVSPRVGRIRLGGGVAATAGRPAVSRHFLRMRSVSCGEEDRYTTFPTASYRVTAACPAPSGVVAADCRSCSTREANSAVVSTPPNGTIRS